MKKGLVFLGLLFYFLYFPVSSEAQLDMGGLTQPIQIADLSSELNMNAYPAYPKPGQSVSVSLEMYTENLDTAYITWILNGKKSLNGVGVKNFNFIAAPDGVTSNVSVEIILARGETFTKSLTVKASNIDLLWEANSYTPPFYKGKAMFPAQGQVKILALPSLGNSSDYIYNWEVNGEIAQISSGYGKSAILLNGPVLGKPLQVNVVANNPNIPITVKGSIIIEPKNLNISFYEDSPLYGPIFERAITGNVTLSTEETSVLAVPFGINQENMNMLKYSWKINGITVPEIVGRSVIFRKPEETSGVSIISLSVENPLRPLQFTEGKFSINFK